METDKGFYGKYRIERVDGEPINPESLHFVLMLSTDPAARDAVLLYARLSGNKLLENDLRDIFDEEGLSYTVERGVSKFV